MYFSKLFGSKKKENSQPTLEQTTQKMNKAQIYNLIIVDESGSMSHLRQATLSGINETIDTIKNAQKEFADTQSHFITLVTFDKGVTTNIRYHYNNEPIDNVPTFTNYQPRGCTPLYDTMGQTLTSLYNKINSDENATAVVTVLTDGLENASCEWNAASLRNLINQLKEQGWSFSYMGSAHNVKDVADLLSIDNFMEFSHDNLGAGNTWDFERSSRTAHFKKMHVMYNEGFSSKEERTSKLKQYAKEYHGNRVTPEYIDHLAPNEVFVFGSNVNGNHNGGAALHALNLFGAIMGQGEGIQGNSYAIPTTGISYEDFCEAIYRFIEFAAQHPETHFYVTRIGCGNAGYSPIEVAPHFKCCAHLENVSLPEDFWAILGLKMKF
jgi:hypothetical protein